MEREYYHLIDPLDLFQSEIMSALEKETIQRLSRLQLTHNIKFSTQSERFLNIHKTKTAWPGLHTMVNYNRILSHLHDFMKEQDMIQ
ncbi:hypothetical protein CLQ_20131 [Clostridium botulinum Af84]|uniref:hypothetical protein n=1 Tax=Clostridium botulinum TaxID=1491 RepID=UPI00035BA5DC|nr:hypothetical protein [Clostridium botulinum]EPS53175.1 hypothetical protein CLQ_20131 [Clostridium botulinum Af84]OSA83038.1 hypothetical protein B2H84_04380 [Clostridium botulinum]